MQRNISLFIIYLLASLTLTTNGQAKIDSTHWTFNVQDADGKALEIVMPKSDLQTLEDASPNALMRAFNNSSGQNNNGNGYGYGFRDFFRDAKDSTIYGVGHTIRHLPLEAVGFYSALAALAVYDCAIEVKSNPMACSEFGEMLKDPISHFSFFVFMSTNHSVSHLLNTAGPSSIPRALIPYIGMAAGSFVSGLAVEFLMDTDIQYMRKTFFKSNKTDIDKNRLSQAWQNAYNKFLHPLDPLGISRHLPHLISLPLAAVLSNLTQQNLYNILSGMDRFTYRSLSKELVKINGVYQVAQTTAKPTIARRIFIPALRVVARTGMLLAHAQNPIIGFTLRVGQIVLFFAWNDILHPPIQKAWDLRKYSRKINDQKITILEHLTDGYQPQQLNDVNHFNFFASVFSFLSSNQRESRESLQARAGIQENLIHLLNTSPNDSPLYYSDRNTPIFPEALLDLPNLTEEIETDLFPEEFTRPRGDVLLENIYQLSLYARDYQATLSYEVDMAKMRWKNFFQPALAWQHTTYNFYKYMIETQGQLSFETEPRLPIPATHLSMLRNSPSPEASGLYNQYLSSIRNTKSKGMLDALYFSSRPLNESNNMPARRLLDESKVLQFGVEPHVVHELSDTDIQWLYEKLSNEKTFFSKKPNDNHLSLVALLNKGFDISQMHDFEDFDFQARANTIFNSNPTLRLNSDILYTKNTQDIYNFTRFLEAQPEGMRSYYLRLANQGWDWSQFYTFNTNDITVRYNALNLGLPGELLKTKSTRDIDRITEFLETQSEPNKFFYITFVNYGWDWDQLLTLTEEDIHLLTRADRFGLDPEYLKTNTLQDISGFIQLLEGSMPAAVRSHYVNIANQKWKKEVETEINIPQSQVSIVQNGATHFSSPVYEDSRHYGIIYYSTLEKLLISMVCGESIEEIDLVQRSAFGLGGLEFNPPRIWKSKPTFCDQIETVHQPFSVQEDDQNIYYYSLLDYASKNIYYQTTLEEFEDFWNDQVLPATEPVKSRYMRRKTMILAEDISSTYTDTSYLTQQNYPSYLHNSAINIHSATVNTAKGIRQFSRDMTNYYLNLLVALLPKQASFSNPLQGYVTCIRQLSEYPNYNFKQIVSVPAPCQEEEGTWADQIEDTFQIDNAIEIVNNTQVIPVIHRAMLEHTVANTYNYIQTHLPTHQNSIALLKIAEAILGTIQTTISQSSRMEMEFVTLEEDAN